MPFSGSYRILTAKLKDRSQIASGKLVAQDPAIKREPTLPNPAPLGSLWQIFLIWLKIGLQSFGGGATTTLLIRREMLQKRGWFNDYQYNEMWTLCNLAPGINLIAFAIIIGNRLAGIGGAFACMLGMLLPSALVTTLITAAFTSVQNWLPFQAVMRGVIPAVIGLSFVFVVQFAQPVFKQSWQEGKKSFGVHLLWAGTCAILLGILKLSAVLVFVASALLAALILPRILPGMAIQQTVSISGEIKNTDVKKVTSGKVED